MSTELLWSLIGVTLAHLWFLDPRWGVPLLGVALVLGATL